MGLRRRRGLKSESRPGKHRVEFRYTGISFGSPEQVRFRYRLEPLDTEWVEAGERRTAFYSYVPPGQYRFRVMACDSGGTWNEAGASLSLVVLPHWWQTWWFVGLAALGLMASVAGAVRIAEKRKHQRRLELLEQERALERERARIAQDLHDDLGSSLTRISLLSDLARADKRKSEPGGGAHAEDLPVGRPDRAGAGGDRVGVAARAATRCKAWWSTSRILPTSCLKATPPRCRLDLPHDLPTHSLPPEMRHNIFLIVKEALTNALKHAIAREVRVQAKATATVLEIWFRTTGRDSKRNRCRPRRASAMAWATCAGAPRTWEEHWRSRAGAGRGPRAAERESFPSLSRDRLWPHIHAVVKRSRAVPEWAGERATSR